MTSYYNINDNNKVREHIHMHMINVQFTNLATIVNLLQ